MSENDQEGKKTLRRLIEILVDVIEYIDSLEGIDPKDISIDSVRSRTKRFHDYLKAEVDCEMAEFRLQVFYSLAIATGFTKPGPHLECVFYPVEGSACFEHFQDMSFTKTTMSQALSMFRDHVELNDTNDEE